MSNSEWEAQQEANRWIEERQSGDGQDERSKYASYQPPVFETQQRSVAEYLIVKDFTLLRVQGRSDNTLAFVFADRGTEPTKSARLFVEGKLSFDNNALTDAARKHANDCINAAILEHRHFQNKR